MTKLVKTLIIGGTSTAVVGGAGAGVGVSLSSKKTSNQAAKPVAKVATQYAVPTPMATATPNLVPTLAPQMVPNAIPSLVPEQVAKIPHLVFKPVLPAGGFVFGGRTQVVTPPLKGTYQTHEGINHAEAIDGYLQTTPQAVPNAVPYQVPQTVEPTFPAKGLVFGAHAQEDVPPLKGTIQTHEGIHHLALDSDMQLIPETPAHPTLPQAVPYVVPAMQPNVYKNTLGDPYIQNEWVEYNGAAVVWSVDDHQVPFLYKAPVAPTATPSMIPGLVPTATPTQVLPEQKVPMMINNYGPVSSDWYATAMGHDQYATPYQVPTQMVVTPSLRDEVKPVAHAYAVPAYVYVAPQAIPLKTQPGLAPSLGLIPTPLVAPLAPHLVPQKVVTPELKSVSEETSVETISVDPASKIAPAYIVGAASQPYFQVITGQSKPLVDTIRADYHIYEGFNHAEYIDGVKQETPTLIPVIAPYLTPMLPQTAVEELDKESSVDEISLVSTDVVEDKESTDTSFAAITAAPRHVYSPLNFEQHHRTLEEIMRTYFCGTRDHANTRYSQDELSRAFFGYSSQAIRDAANHVFGSLRTTGDRDARMFSLHDHIINHF